MKKILFFLFILILSIEISFAYSFDIECCDPPDFSPIYDLNDLLKIDKYSFNSTDLIKDYNNSSQYCVQVLHNGKPVKASQEVKFIINGVRYTRLTDENGIAKLNINLNPGHYIVYSEYNTYKNYNNILVL